MNEKISTKEQELDFHGDLPFRHAQYAGLTIEGFSRAAMQTYWRIPELKLGFDLGSQPWSFMGTPRWFVSHSHMDHLLALPAYVARRRMMKMTPPQIYMPIQAVENVKHLLSAFTKLDHGRLPCELIGVSPGDEIELSRELVVSVTKTFHTIPSVGYVVWERRKKLKEKFLSLTGNEIRDLKMTGEEITDEIRIPRVAYLGDSTSEGLDAFPAMYESDVIILEISFVAKRHRGDSIHKFGHIHLDDIIERKDRFHNKVVIASHFSTRYSDTEIENTIRRRLPDLLDGRLVLWF